MPAPCRSKSGPTSRTGCCCTTTGRRKRRLVNRFARAFISRVLHERAVEQGDYFAVELISGHVYLHLDLGSGGAKVKATSRRIDDGAWHEIAISRNGKGGRITVDGASTDFVTPGGWSRSPPARDASVT